MAHDQPGRLSGILERLQDMQGLPQTGEMLLGQIQQKAGDAPCMAGCIGAGGRVYEDKQRETHLRLAQGNHGTIFRRSQRAAWPALCAHARNPQHVRAVLPHRCHTGHETHCQGVSFPFFRVKGLLPLGSSPFQTVEKPLNLEKAAFLASFGRSQRSWKILRHKALGLCPKPRRTPHFVSSPFVGGLKPCAARFPCAFPRLRRRREQIQGLRAFRAHSVHICEEGKRVLLETIAADELFRHAAGRRAYFPMRGKGDPMLYL